MKYVSILTWGNRKGKRVIHMVGVASLGSAFDEAARLQKKYDASRVEVLELEEDTGK